MSSLEVGLISIAVGIVVTMISYLFNRQTNTYTKKETDNLVDSKVLPIIKALEADRELSREERRENTKEMKSLNGSITDLRIELANHSNV